MNHCLAQVFRAGLPPRLPERDFVSSPVVFENQWMIHGDIRGPLFKVTDRIASRRHHITPQAVRCRYGAGGAVNEARLNTAPGIDEARAIASRQRLT
jgi:hypothetical protein